MVVSYWRVFRGIIIVRDLCVFVCVYTGKVINKVKKRISHLSDTFSQVKYLFHLLLHFISASNRAALDHDLDSILSGEKNGGFTVVIKQKL